MMPASPPDLTRETRARWAATCALVHGRIAHQFARAEVRDRARRYLTAVLGRIERRNGWQVAEALGEPGPQGVQRLLNGSRWDADAVRDELRRLVFEHLGEPEGVLTIDETGFLKKGTKSVGVKRQYSGTAGRKENCQIGVLLGYASSTGHAFVDRALYLPQEWADDTVRRTEAGVPTGVTFATKPELARQLLEGTWTPDAPAAWLAGDSVYSDDPALRVWLEGKAHPYVLGVSATHMIWQDGIQQRVDAVVAQLPESAWRSQSAGTGVQGERLFAWALVHLPVPTPAGMRAWLLARRRLEDPADRSYFRAWGPATTSLAEMVRVAGTRWTVEQSITEAKSEVGLDEYEVRTWTAWHRHVTLSLLAHAALAIARRGAQEQEEEKGGTSA
jgi:SRSO17 transposase